MLVVIFLLGIISVGLVGLYIGQGRFTDSELKLGHAQSELAAGLNTAYTYAQQASAILAAATIDSVDYTTSATTAVLSLPGIDASGNALTGISDTLVLTKTVDNKLIMVISPEAGSSRNESTRTLIKKVSAAVFTYGDPATLINSSWFDLRAEQQVTVSGGTRTLGQHFRIDLKNK